MYFKMFIMPFHKRYKIIITTQFTEIWLGYF